MSINISKKAILHNPLINNVIDIEEPTPKLNSFLNNIPYLNNLIKGNLKVKPLRLGNSESTYKAVIALKIALNVIDSYTEHEFDMTSGLFNTTLINAGKFDTTMKNAVIEFQVFANLTPTGIIDSETLSKIDFYLYDNIIIDLTNNEIIGKPKENNILVNSTINENGVFSYNIIINGKIFLLNSVESLSINPIENVQENDNKLRIEPNDTIKNNLIENQESISEIDKKIILDAKYLTLKRQELILVNQDQELTDSNIDNELNTTPPKIFSDEHAELYLVKDNDNIGQIIENRYYGSTYDITNPFYDENDPLTGEEIIHTLPNRQLGNPSTRADDARYQFYLNLIYYYNTPEKIEDGNTIVKEYGIKASPEYQRHQDDNLNSFNMFDNKFEPGENDTILPNYYRFLKTQEGKGTQIQFDGDGNPTSFEMVSNKKIWIPSRIFAESLYYHLNFRHYEMLENQGDKMSFLSIITSPITTALDFLFSIGDIAEHLYDTTKQLYHEALDFFKKIYNFSINILTYVIPRGIGAKAGVGIGVTWGYPIATDLKGSKTIWRKMSKQNELTFVLRERYEAFVGLDSGVGLSSSVGFKTGLGKKKKTMGLGVVAGLRVGFEPNLTLEYEFPIRPEETGLLTMVITAFGGTFLKTGSTMLSALNVINLDPRQYLTWMKFSLPGKIEGHANAQLGFDNTTTTIPEAQDKSYLNSDNIWNKLPGVGIQGNVQAAIGLEMEYIAKYNDNPLVPKVDGRVPSEVEVKRQFFAETSLQTGTMGNIMQRFFMSFTAIPTLLNIFNFDKGVAIGLSNKFTRETTASEIELQDIDQSIPEPNIISNNGETTGKMEIIGDNGKWESQMLLTYYSGDVDALFVNGAETTIKLNSHKIYNVINSGTANDFFSLNNVENILSIIYSIELQRKIGFEKHKQRKKLSNEVFSKYNNSTGFGSKRNFLQNAKKYGFVFYLGAYVKIEFKTKQLDNAFKYFIKRWYLMLKNNKEAWKKLTDEIESKIQDFKKNNPYIITTETGDKVITISDFYSGLYEELNLFINNYIDVNNDDFVVDDAGFDFKKTLNLYFISIRYFVNYLIDPLSALSEIKTEASKIFEDMQLEKLLKVISVLAEVIDARIALEAKAGISVGATIKAAYGAKVRLSLSGEAAIIDRTLFMEDGEFLQLEFGDSFKRIFNEVEALANAALGNQRQEGIRNEFLNLPI